MIKIIYNKGKGPKEYTKEYETLEEAMKGEGMQFLKGKVYKNNILLLNNK